MKYKIHAPTTETGNTHRATIDMRGAAWIVEGGDKLYKMEQCKYPATITAEI
jgi:hypothetical protein